MSADVSVVQTKQAEYPSHSPYHPSEYYPEYPFGSCITDEPNEVYAAVREALHLLGLDAKQYGSSSWNPFRHIIKPGMTVVIKPNWVRSRHFSDGELYSIITHPSVIRAAIDYCWIALQGNGTIIIADAPQHDCNFHELVTVCGLEQLRSFYDGIAGPKVEYYDLRRYWSVGKHFPSMKRTLPGDPKGSAIVNLGKNSEVYQKKQSNRFYGAVYHRRETSYHHTGERQEYSIARTILNADVVISIPKLKVHKKVGVTLNMKNFVGAATNTNLHVHYMLGSPSEGGDQFPDGLFTPMERNIIKIERWMYDHLLAKQSIPLEYIHRSIYWLHGTFIKPLGIGIPKQKRVFDAGSWYGNDCAWRFVVDLPRIVTFADRDGKLHNKPQRKIFSFVDGVVGGENKGPLEPDARPVGIIVAGENMIATDLVATRLMGFDWRKLKIFTHILKQSRFRFGIKDVQDITVHAKDKHIRKCLTHTKDRFLAFVPHPGWVDHIEI